MRGGSSARDETEAGSPGPESTRWKLEQGLVEPSRGGPTKGRPLCAQPEVTIRRRVADRVHGSDAMDPDPQPPRTPDLTEPVEIPEHIVILLLEGGQRFLGKIEEIMEGDDAGLQDYYIKKTLAILEELHRRLNHEQGGELVDNLMRLYGWWGREIIASGETGDVHRLKIIATQMGEIRKAWEHVLFRGEGLTENPEF